MWYLSFIRNFPWEPWLDEFDRYAPLGDRNQEGASLKNRPHPLFGTAPPPQRHIWKGDISKMADNHEVFMKTTELDKNQLIIKIDQDTTSVGEMADVLAEGYGPATNSLVLWSSQALRHVDAAVTGEPGD